MSGWNNATRFSLSMVERDDDDDDDDDRKHGGTIYEGIVRGRMRASTS